uniref:DNA polymerase III subunit gamma/tau n=1 Tax=Flavobacterium sp. TaxID=239 RepID=UPI004049F98C
MTQPVLKEPETPIKVPEKPATDLPENKPEPEVLPNPTLQTNAQSILTNRINPMSLSSIGARKVIQQNLEGIQKPADSFAHEPFTENQMQIVWNKFAQNLENKGEMLQNALVSMSIPTLEGTTIIHELPNEGTRIEFLQKIETKLLGFLRGNLHNHDIEIKIIVNETIEQKKAFTVEDKYQLLVEKNPLLEDLRRFFELDLG